MAPRTTKIRIGATLLLLVAGSLFSALIFIPFPREPAYQFVETWGTRGSEPGEFEDPTGIVVADGKVFVADARNGRIQVFDYSGVFLHAFGKQGRGLGELGRPMNLAARGGAVFVPEYFNDRIQIFDLDGMAHELLGKPGTGPDLFDAPGGIAVDDYGNLYVADFNNHRIQKISRSGALLRQWGTTQKSSARSGQFSYPTDVAIDQRGYIYVADGYNDRIQVFTPEGVFSHKWGGPFAINIHGPFNGWFATVTGLAVGPDGNIFVADFYNHRIQKFSPDGTFLTSFGKRGSGPAEFEYPMSVSVAPDGTVFVTDFGNNRVQEWEPSPRPRQTR